MITNSFCKIFVAGITNLETTLHCGEEFPIEYRKSRFAFNGIQDRLGGVGFNVSNALAQLGAPVGLLTMLGKDLLGEHLESKIKSIDGLDTDGVLRVQDSTLRSTILVEPTGRAGIFTDLKDSQDIAYPFEQVSDTIDQRCIVHCTNINWAYAVAIEAKKKGALVSTDVQAISSLDDDYNLRFIDAADIVFFSGENLNEPPENIVHQLMDQYDVSLVICSLGEKGALLGDCSDQSIRTQKALPVQKINNVTGAGDALCAGFLWGLQKGFSPWDSLQLAQIIASQRISKSSDQSGIPTPELVKEIFDQLRNK